MTTGKPTVWKKGIQYPFDCGCGVNVDPSDDIPGEATLFLFPCAGHKEALIDEE